jgi:hypothetical protein
LCLFSRLCSALLFLPKTSVYISNRKSL